MILIGFFKKQIQKHVEKLKKEREGTKKMPAVCEKGTFTYDTINHNEKVLDFKIIVLEVLFLRRGYGN